MEIHYHKSFLKAYRKNIQVNKKLDLQFRRRVDIFKQNHMHPILRNHPLRGNKKGLRSFSITGDVRVVYFSEDDSVTFLDIGTHNQVY